MGRDSGQEPKCGDAVSGAAIPKLLGAGAEGGGRGAQLKQSGTQSSEHHIVNQQETKLPETHPWHTQEPAWYGRAAAAGVHLLLFCTNEEGTESSLLPSTVHHSSTHSINAYYGERGRPTEAAEEGR